MAKQITAINRDAIHRICSGQVVLNLATAVKELIENSLDAGATTVEIRLKEYGSELIEVSDNGKGIHPDDFEAIALKHHTSKIQDFSDLVDVQTFGFRGEALSSLCAVSEVVVTTKYINEPYGSKLKFNHSGILQEKHTFARQTGTTVTLSNLFASLPVRQKEFHRNMKKEFTKAVQLLSAYCLISENVKIICVNQTKKSGKTTFLATQENKTIRENISCVFGTKQLTNLLEITETFIDEEIVQAYGLKEGNTETFKLRGFISSCEHGCGRGNTERQFYYINSRPCEPTKVMKLTNEVYHRYNLQQYPFVLLNIIVPKESVDVNVTPDKRSIFLENEKLLFACLKSTLIRIFENIPSTYRVNVPNSINSSTEAKVTNQKSLIDLKNWKNSTDVCNRQLTLQFGQKRPLPQLSQNATCSKQMKLVPEQKRTVVKDIETYDSPHEEEHAIDKNESSPDKCSIPNENSRENISHARVFHLTKSSPVKQDRISRISKITEKQRKFPSVKNIDLLEHEQKLVEINFSESIQNESSRAELVTTNGQNESSPDSNRTESSQMEILTNSTDQRSSNVEVCEPIIKNEQKTSDEFSTGSISETIVETSGHFSNSKLQKAVLTTNISSIRELINVKQRKRLPEHISNKFHVEIDPTKNHNAEEELMKEISKNMFKEMKIIGQFNLGFIITKLKNDLFIVDQHATDEKFNFETLQQTTTLKNQKLIIPQDLNLTATNECILIDNIEILQKNGFEFLIDHSAKVTKKVKLVSIPVSQNWQFGKDDIDELLFMLQDAPNTLCRPSRIRAMFASRACRKSVMIGTALGLGDMRRLIDNMGKIEQPWNCPHGRPTMRHLVNLSMLQ